MRLFKNSEFYGQSTGFTLVEVVVALAILGIAMLGAYSVVTMSTQTRENAHNHYVATVIANNRIERAKNLTFDGISALAEDRIAVNELGAPDAEGAYRRTTRIDTSWDGDPMVTRIAVEVEVPQLLRNPTRSPDSVLVSTLLTDYLEP